MFEFLLERSFGLSYDVVAVLNGVALALFAILLIIHICIFAKMITEKISDPKGFEHRSLQIFPIFMGLILSIIITGFLSISMMWIVSESNLQKESLANNTVITHYEVNKVGNNLVFQRKDKASYLVGSKSVEIKEENEKEYVFLVDNKIYKINKEDVQ